MFHDLNVRLAEVKEKGRSYRKWDKRLEDLVLDLSHYESETKNWEQRLQREEQEVERLTGMTLSNLVYSIMGKKAEKIEREQLDVLEAKVKYDEALRTMKDMEDQIQDVQKELARLRGWKVEYDAIIRQKEQSLVHGNKDIMALVDRQTDLKLTLKELKEAIQAGFLVVESLGSAADGLQKARNWGTYDMLGGGMISTHLKHSNIDEAMEYIHNAQRELSRFSKELRDVQVSASIEIDIGDFLKFSDYFFDGFISDWMVQGRINDTLDQVEAKTYVINEILQQLNNEHVTLESELANVDRQYMTIIEQA
ncbi:hypothetical protein [Paenibacillus glacialis]|uniref:Uncharacterized protein n=1 Tax=Paenibacillus glacialis TaxID=494026 RepID=A0A168H2Y8_9BACL|nr:hypothetical protein [Paenibacillus glacialis]OAB37765.1 hypothetical protein PGLA_20535 [Paenibacillus glacialis]